MTRKVVYIAHAFGGDPENLERAIHWVGWAAMEGVAPVATWITLCDLWPDSYEHRAAGMACNLAVIERCDELWLTGPRMSPGMTTEQAHAFDQRVPVVDLVGMTFDSASDFLRNRDITRKRPVGKRPVVAVSPTCETCGAPVREGLRFCAGLSPCWSHYVRTRKVAP